MAEAWVPPPAPPAQPPPPAEPPAGDADGTEGEAAAAAEAAADAAAEEAATAKAAALPPRRVQLGRAAAEYLASGKELPDELLVSVLVDAMVALGEKPEPPPDAKPAKPKSGTKGASLAKPGSASVEPEPQQGFVIDGFPRTRRQSELLEAALTGLDLASEAAVVAAASVIAPPPPGALPQMQRPLLSGLDAVLVLGLTDEAAALKRAVGCRVDPATGRVYHLEFDPPPAGDPGLSARLVEPPDASNSAVQVQRRLAAYASQAAELDEWLKRFLKLRRPVDGFGPKGEVLASAGDVAEGLLRAKAAVASARGAAEAAQKARCSAEEAVEFASLAAGHAEAAARELLVAKKAELAAAALLTDPKSKVQDTAATEVLKAQSAAKCAESLRVCKVRERGGK
eukprot:221647-Chlamydomonas_euryale.AAC.1